MPFPGIPIIVILVVAIWFAGQIIQAHQALSVDLSYVNHGMRFKHKPPLGVAQLVSKLITIDRFVKEQIQLSPAEKDRMLAFYVEVFWVGDVISSGFNRTEDPEVNGTIDYRNLLLGRNQDVIMVRQLADLSNLTLYHEFAYHLYPYIRYKDANPEHRKDFAWIETRLQEIERGTV